jgi:hypothetical protein
MSENHVAYEGISVFDIGIGLHVHSDCTGLQGFSDVESIIANGTAGE